jgi:hypothetical protein
MLKWFAWLSKNAVKYKRFYPNSLTLLNIDVQIEGG